MIIEEFIDAEILNSLNTNLNSYFNFFNIWSFVLILIKETNLFNIQCLTKHLMSLEL